jgi:biopolymer transport protein ExbB/TolQ
MIENLADIGIIAGLTVLIVVLSVFVIVLKLKNTKLLSLVAQFFVDKTVLSEEVDRLSILVNNGPAIENDFVKFLSDSRNSAYEYIEEVQAAIEALYKAMESDKESNIDKAYKALLEFLPSKNTGMVE